MDMLEIEIKAHCADLIAVRDAVVSRGAVFSGERTERDMYFSHPAKNFKDTDEALRIRQVDGKSVLTYKGPKIGTRAKSRFEAEVAVDDFDTMRGILFKLGFSEAGHVKKNRRYYKLNDIEITLDDVEGLGSFVELEKKHTDREMVENEILALAKELGLTRLERRSYLEMILGGK